MSVSKRRIDNSEVVAEVSVSSENVSEVKATLFKQVHQAIDLNDGKPTSEEMKMKAIMDSCFQEKISGSVLVIGAAGSGKRQFADRILRSYKTPIGDAIKVARLQGLAHTKDRDALISLAKQVGIYNESDNFSMSVEALQSHFQQARFLSVPTVILIEDIDEFTQGSRQVLLYTLLDLMHRQEVYFVIIGLSQRIDIKSLLEKRVISRLSAQCVYLRPKSAQEIKDILVDTLTIKYITCREEGSSSSATFTPASKRIKLSNTNNVESKEIVNRELEQYINKFNASIQQLFGPRPLKALCRKQTLPLVSELIADNVSMGDDVNFFLSIATLVVSRLSTQQPLVTHEMLADCFAQMALPSMETTVASLPLVELYLLAAAIRLHIRHCGGGTFAHVDPAVQKNGSRVIKSKKMMGFNVDQLLEETEKLTGIVRKKIVSRRDLVDAVSSLAQTSNLLHLSNGKQFQFAKSGSACVVLEKTQVTLNASLIEFQATFSSRRLHMSDKLRKAVLDPLEPLTYGGVMQMPRADGESKSLNAMIQLV